jgi:hypothetical protein
MQRPFLISSAQRPLVKTLAAADFLQIWFDSGRDRRHQQRISTSHVKEYGRA